MEVLKYVKYCLSLFEECTINGLGTLQFIEAPPERDINNNLIKKKYYLISFKSAPLSRPRLTNIIAGKEGCSTEAAIAAIDSFVESIKTQLKQNKEAWLSEIGLLKKQGDDILLMSHKFLVKSFKNNQSQSPSSSKKELESDVMDSPRTLTDIVPSSAIPSYSLPTVEETPFVPEPKTSPAPAKTREYLAPVESAAAETPAKNENKKTVAATIPAGAITPNPSASEAKQEEAFSKKAERFVKKNMVYLGIAFGLFGAVMLSIYFFKGDSSKQDNGSIASTTPLSNNNITDQTISDQPSVNKDNSDTENLNTTKDKNNMVVLTVNKDNSTDAEKKKSAEDDKKLNYRDAAANANSATKGSAPTSIMPAPAPNTMVDTKTPIPVIAGPQATIKTELPVTSTTTTAPPAVSENAPAKKEEQEVKETSKSDEIKLLEAQFPGGEKAIDKFIRNKLQYPDKALDEDISGSVKVTFTVDENGKVRNPVVTEGLGGGCNEEALRVLNLMPQWVPATRDGQKVASKKSIKITFKQGGGRPTPRP